MDIVTLPDDAGGGALDETVRALFQLQSQALIEGVSGAVPISLLLLIYQEPASDDSSPEGLGIMYSRRPFVRDELCGRAATERQGVRNLK